MIPFSFQIRTEDGIYGWGFANVYFSYRVNMAAQYIFVHLFKRLNWFWLGSLLPDSLCIWYGLTFYLQAYWDISSLNCHIFHLAWPQQRMVDTWNGRFFSLNHNFSLHDNQPLKLFPKWQPKAQSYKRVKAVAFGEWYGSYKLVKIGQAKHQIKTSLS